MSITSRPLDAPRPRSLAVRLRVALAGLVGAISGVAPHVLHHVGPIAGAAIVTGLTGTMVFGAIGLVLMIPTLLRLRRRFGSWAAPGIALLVFAALFSVSTVWIGPAIRGTEAVPDVHSTDHPAHEPSGGTSAGTP